MSERGSPLRVMVLGVRGIGNIQGGVETHATQLYPRLAALGCDIEVLVRSPFSPAERKTYGTLRLKRLWSPTRPGVETALHSLLGVCHAAISRPDVLHIHAIGPALVAPLARLAGLKVVVTHHGPDYEREKWGWVARAVLRWGERAGARWAHRIISISGVIADQLWARYGRDSVVIPNGVAAPGQGLSDAHPRGLGLEPGRYFLMVGRMVREKRQLDLIEAYRRIRTGWKMVLAGELQEGEYTAAVVEAAGAANVVLPGFVHGEQLSQLYAHAGAFVLPSSHEGLPIALLEALSYGLPVLASDIPANLEVGLDASCYFRLGDIGQLATEMLRVAATPVDPAARTAISRWTLERFDWDSIARRTLSVYEQVCAPRD